MDVYCTESYSVVCEVGGLVDTGTGHSITAPGWSWRGTKVALSESVHLQIEFSRSSRMLGLLGDVEEAGTWNTQLTPRDWLSKVTWTGLVVEMPSSERWRQ